MHSVRVTSRTREVSTEMNAVCARKRKRLIVDVRSASGRSAQPRRAGEVTSARLETESSRTV